jgi:hypothetical protein
MSKIKKNIKTSTSHNSSFNTTEDVLKVTEKIKIMSNKLDITLNKMKEKTEKIKFKNNNSNSSFSTSNLFDFDKKIENNKIENPFETTNYKILLNKLKNLIKNGISDEKIYKDLNIEYKKLNSDQKIDFIKHLKNNFENPFYLENIAINIFLDFYDYVLNILSKELIHNNKNEILLLQNFCEYLKNFRNLNDIFKLFLFLLRKYFPKNLNNKISDVYLVNLKIILYLLKESLKTFLNSNENKINPKEIINEINELFIITPPSSLTTLTPNAFFYQQIFTLLKSITDEIINKYKENLDEIIKYLKTKIVSEDYIKYLNRMSIIIKNNNNNNNNNN